eukprot:scaffold560_cov139-Skeletonema_menzelii.AAC.1
MQSTVGVAFLDASLAGYDKYASTHKCASVMLPAANPTSSLQRHIQNESMNATAVCLAVDGDTVANKAGCRRASWYLRTVVLNKLREVTKLMDFIFSYATEKVVQYSEVPRTRPPG